LELCADHPPGCSPSVRWRAGLPEAPRIGIGLELLQVGRWKVIRPVLVRIDAGPLRRARLERGQTRRTHASLVCQFADAANVRDAPIASLGAWGEPRGVDLIRDPVGDAVDPAEAEGLVDGFGIGDRRLGDVLLVITDPCFALAAVVLLEPGP